ncbi:helix-turn-helix transcriptional regulator [Streptomyces sp. HPF1205]|uniref:helix-turn-helix transcriptional regulator n=1 Tax=Streptomyces sp. HPF1205 TaxID=2873262 RepID=UPI001CEDCEB7|nr:helix-turn-helix transcriptional regulator [Streptomyces sp. HPF1205]
MADDPGQRRDGAAPRHAGGEGPRRPELAQFLRAMRARIGPREAGLPDVGRRRTPGLRRQEVAQLAAVSVDWYIRLEQGRVGVPGTAVLDAVAAALRLSPAERRHLYLVARGEAPPVAYTPAPVTASLRTLLDGMPVWPAYVVDFRTDVLARNAAAAALFGEDFGTGRAANASRLLFDPSSALRAAQLDWERIAREAVGNLRANHARHRDDPGMSALVAELRLLSPQFGIWWDDHTIGTRSHGTKRLRHPSAGELTVRYDVLATCDGSEQYLLALTPADPATERALRRLVTDRDERLGAPNVHAIGPRASGL